MFLIFLIYAFFISLGILGTGHFIWLRIKQESGSRIAKTNAPLFHEHFSLTWGISWLLGYFFYEGTLTFFLMCQLFKPLVILTLGGGLSLSGIYWLFCQKHFIFQNLGALKNSFLESFLLWGMALFLFFWNLYPAFDVDSLAFYFTAIQQFLEHGGRFFSPFSDIRHAVPLGENYLYALGFAAQPQSTLLPQFIHGISKVMLFFCVYGAAKSLGAGFFSLVAAAFVLSEEHLVASGANVSIRINISLTLSLFLLCFGLFIFHKTQKKEYALLAFMAGCYAMICKYLCIAYFICGGMVLLLILIYHKEYTAWKNFSLNKYPFTISFLTATILFTAMPYLYNLIVTGTPVFPATLGPFTSQFYDKTAAEISRTWHYHLSLPHALKNITAFMVWPGILPSKILAPLALISSIFTILCSKKNMNFFKIGMTFFVTSICITTLNALYMVFEMRYYRYGIGIYALACTFLLLFLMRTFIECHSFFKKIQKMTETLFVLLICCFCIAHSFDVMGSSRPSAKDIFAFITQQTSESTIIAKHNPEALASFRHLNQKNLPQKHLAFFLSFGWPHTFFPVPGKDIAFLHSAAFASAIYFNEGLFAQALLKNNIKYVFNQLVTEPNYPLEGGSVYSVLNQCGHPISEGKKELLELSTLCLEKIADKADKKDAQQRLQHALSKIHAYPAYEPFNPPTYGGPFAVIK